MNSQLSSPIRISCPTCGGKVKVPPHATGQRFHCPRCGGDILASAELPAETSEPNEEQAITSAPVPDADMPRLARPLQDDDFSISCQICGTRLHVGAIQVGTTIECPDCYSPVTVPPPPKRSQPWQVAKQAWHDAESSVAGPNAIHVAAQARLDKARADMEQEAAKERETSPEHFTDGLLSFFSDPHALGRLAALAIWFEVAVLLFRYATGINVSEDAPTMIGQTASLVAMLTMAFMFLIFLFAVAACGLALVKDTSDGLGKIEHWPEINFLSWRLDVFYVFNAGVLAALPGVALGFVLAPFFGNSVLVLYGAAASFGALFPPMLLSMLYSDSARAPFLKEAWGSIRVRPDPWNLTYLITSIVIIAGVVACDFCLSSGFIAGLILATVMVALIMMYFRTIGRLFGFLAGRDILRAANSQQHSSESQAMGEK